jgi:hypothetical protein
LKLNWYNPEIENLDGRPKDKVGLQSGKVYVLELAEKSPSPSAFRDSHEGKEENQPCETISGGHSGRYGAARDIPMGVNINWSAITLFNAGSVAWFLVIGNALDKNPNHWN